MLGPIWSFSKVEPCIRYQPLYQSLLCGKDLFGSLTGFPHYYSPVSLLRPSDNSMASVYTAVRNPILKAFTQMQSMLLSLSIFAALLFTPLAATGQQDSNKNSDNRVSVFLPFEDPAHDEIINAIPMSNVQRQNVHIDCELKSFEIEEPRHYPLIGWARASSVSFKCTVNSDGADEIVIIKKHSFLRHQP